MIDQYEDDFAGRSRRRARDLSWLSRKIGFLRRFNAHRTHAIARCVLIFTMAASKFAKKLISAIERTSKPRR
jgi:hypothetical protein